MTRKKNSPSLAAEFVAWTIALAVLAVFLTLVYKMITWILGV